MRKRPVGKGIGRIAGAATQQILDVPLVFADKVQRDHLGLERSQFLDRRIKGDRFSSPTTHLERLVDGKQQVGNSGWESSRPLKQNRAQDGAYSVLRNLHLRADAAGTAGISFYPEPCRRLPPARSASYGGDP